MKAETCLHRGHRGTLRRKVLHHRWRGHAGRTTLGAGHGFSLTVQQNPPHSLIQRAAHRLRATIIESHHLPGDLAQAH